MLLVQVPLYCCLLKINGCLLICTISLTTDGALAADGDFIGVTCLTTFTTGSGPGDSSTPPCNITITNDLILEPDETFSLNASIQNSNGQSAQFSAGGDTASATILDDDGMSFVLVYVDHTQCVKCFELNQIGMWTSMHSLPIIHPPFTNTNLNLKWEGGLHSQLSAPTNVCTW